MYYNYFGAVLGALLIALGSWGIATGETIDKWFFRIKRKENPIIFWCQVGIYIAVGAAAFIESVNNVMKLTG